MRQIPMSGPDRNRGGRPILYTEEAIVAAGKRLAEAGKDVTPSALHRALQGGSQARLAKVWREYVDRAGISITNWKGKAAELDAELERKKLQLKDVEEKLAHAKVAIDAVTDQFNAVKLENTGLRAKLNAQSELIAALHGRVDEQARTLSKLAHAKKSS